MTAPQEKTSDKLSFCDLRFRLINDGSELFSSIAALPSNAARNIRACHLMYLGMLVESGRLFGGMQLLPSQSSANDAQVNVPTKTAMAAPAEVPAAVAVLEAAPEVQIHPDDLAEIFSR